MSFEKLSECINRAIQTDPQGLASLRAMGTLNVQVTVLGPHRDVYLLLKEGALSIVTTPSSKVHVHITGSPMALLQLLRGHTSMRHDISLRGQVEQLNVLKRTLSVLNIDWEALLAPWVGNTWAHPIAHYGQRFARWVRQTASNLHQQTKEYLEEETTFLPHVDVFESFCSDVLSLNTALERLDIQLKRLPQ